MNGFKKNLKHLCHASLRRGVVLFFCGLAACQTTEDPLSSQPLIHDNYAEIGHKFASDPLPITVAGVPKPVKGGQHRVSSGETLYMVAKSYNISQKDIIFLNQLKPPYHLQAGQPLDLPVVRTYHAKEGDTLYHISRLFGVDQSRIARLNRIARPYVITTGQVLILPGAIQPSARDIPFLVAHSSGRPEGAFVLAQGDHDPEDKVVWDAPPEYADKSGAGEAPQASFAPALGLPLEEPQERVTTGPENKHKITTVEVSPPPSAEQQDVESLRQKKAQTQVRGYDLPNQPLPFFADHGDPEQNPLQMKLDSAFAASLGRTDTPSEKDKKPQSDMAGLAGPELPEWPRLPGEFLIKIDQKPLDFLQEASQGEQGAVPLPPLKPQKTISTKVEGQFSDLKERSSVGEHPKPMQQAVTLPPVKPKRFRAQPGQYRQAGRAVGMPPPRSQNTFLWPVRGTILEDYGPTGDGRHNDGINIAAERGSDIKASENGVVVYVGNALRGFGNLILIKHADRWMSAYGHSDRILVRHGDIVKRGQVIGKVGTTGAVSTPQLHFELRRGTNAVNPERYLGRASNVAAMP